jgi:thioredoxin-related protein
MKKLLMILAAVPVLLGLNAGVARAAGLEFQEYDLAMKQAAEEKKYVMVFFWADWCRYCAQIRREVFSSEDVKKIFDENFLAVSVDVENDAQELSGKYRASNSLPTVTFLKPDGEVYGYFDGAVSPEVFIELLGYVRKGEAEDGAGKADSKPDKTAAAEKKAAPEKPAEAEKTTE